MTIIPSTLLELNSNIEWWNHYVEQVLSGLTGCLRHLTHCCSSYDGLKKLFPSTPLDPSYHSTQQHQESTTILPTHNSTSLDKWATPDEFRQALDRERNKVADFYRSKVQELEHSLELLEQEVTMLEDRDLGTDDVIKEEDEEEEEEDDDGNRATESHGLLDSQVPATSSKPPVKSRTSMFARLAPPFGRSKRKRTGRHEADILEASLGDMGRVRSRSTSVGMDQSIASGFPGDERLNITNSTGRVPAPKRGRRSSDMESFDDGNGMLDRRTSISSASSHERDASRPLLRFHSLGLVHMDPVSVPTNMTNGYGEGEEQGVRMRETVLIWTANNQYGIVLRIGFKKRISAIWLDTYSLKQYVELNLTAFEKILKK